MKFLKLIFKIAIGLTGIVIIFIIALLNSESYETVNKNIGNVTTVVEYKKVFGRKISESSINSIGLYHGPSKSWDIFKGTLRSEGNYNNGYWHGRWKDYDKDGQLIMLREWKFGELIKVFVPAGESFKELPKDEWPKYANVKQNSPQQAYK